jgi:hypothetical protein
MGMLAISQVLRHPLPESEQVIPLPVQLAEQYAVVFAVIEIGELSHE